MLRDQKGNPQQLKLLDQRYYQNAMFLTLYVFDCYDHDCANACPILSFRRVSQYSNRIHATRGQPMANSN